MMENDFRKSGCLQGRAPRCLRGGVGLRERVTELPNVTGARDAERVCQESVRATATYWDPVLESGASASLS